MNRSLAFTLVALPLWISSVPAYAGAADSESSAAVRITLTIPPFAAGLAAQAEGAVGLWTMNGSKVPLMVKLPDAIGQGDSEAAIFTTGGTPVRIASSSPAVSVAPQTRVTNNGLVRHGFALRYDRSNRDAAPSDAATLVIAGL